MHPASTLLFLIGYGLSLPALIKFLQVIRQGNRLALFGHQVGMMLAAFGWALRGSVYIAVLHGAWMIVVRIVSRLAR